MKHEPIIVKEHERIEAKLPEHIQQAIKEDLLRRTSRMPIDRLRYLGLEYDWQTGFSAGYYVGLSWLDAENDTAIIVKPKIEGINYATLFMRCFEDKASNDGLDEIFHIDIDATPIEVPANTFQLEPLIIIYFVSLVERIVRSGLRKDYVQREETMTAKIKGRIMLTQYVKKGISTHRTDKIPCRYQEYCEDCLDNRILKRAMLIARDMLMRNASSMGRLSTPLHETLSACLSAFENVSSQISLQDLHRVRINPLFRDYKAAINMAKMIIRKQGYCVQQGQQTGTQLFPPFTINMPLLFERYVLSLLRERYPGAIDFQVNVGDSIPDFTKPDEHLILDSKYITSWREEKDIAENVRQLSGYARHKRIRQRIGIADDTTICPCMVIYPDQNGIDSMIGLSDHLFADDKAKPLTNYIMFKKLGIRLPTQ